MYAPLLKQLIDAFQVLPGVGQKTAQRMAFHLLQRDRDGGRLLSARLDEALQKIGHCEQCRNFSEQPLCTICDNAQRDTSRICVVESPADVVALEQATGYNGRYFVLMGRLSPLDGLGPEDIGAPILEKQLASGEVEELIVATNPSVEGEATAYYLVEMAARHQIATTRIAHGVPIGGELEFIDRNTLAHAFTGRTPLRASES